MSNTALSIPSRLLNAMLDKYPDLDSYYRIATEQYKTLPEYGWPDWCYAPMIIAAALVSSKPFRWPEDAIDVAQVAAVAAWRTTKTIYRPSPWEVMKIQEGKLNRRLSSKRLLRLPAYGVYVDQEIDEFAGFFVHLDFDIHERTQSLRILCVREDLTAFPMAMPIGDMTIGRSIEKTIEKSNGEDANYKYVRIVINSLIYLVL